MNNKLGFIAFLLGLAAVAWVAAGYASGHPLALGMTLLIAAVYLAGGLELRRYGQATGALQQALRALPTGQQDTAPELAAWLAQVPAALRNAVRLRIEGARTGLPGPTMTPYLVGLLVLLGMLGTFLGMVVTLHGAVSALESTTDLAALRAALSAPVKGLGLAFGTSVAGVAASSMLGLVSALCRRERLQAALDLDTHIATTLRTHTPAHEREQAARLQQHSRQLQEQQLAQGQQMLQALQEQARSLPEATAQMHTLMTQLALHSQQLHDRQLASQDLFHKRYQASTEAAYTELARSVDHSLQRSLGDSARAAGAAIQPAVAESMAGITRETAAFQQHLAAAVQSQLEGLSTRFDATVRHVGETWARTAAQQDHSAQQQAAALQSALAAWAGRFEQQSAQLLQTVQHSHAALQAHSASSDQQRLEAWTQSLQEMAARLQQAWQDSGAQSQAQAAQICQTLEQTARAMQAQAQQHASSTITEVTRLLDTAAAAPRLAAEVVGQLRQQLSESLVRDNTMLDERARIMATLSTLLDAVNRAATEQRSAIDTLVANSATVLQQASTQLGQQVAAGTASLATAAVQVSSSAVEMASLGEAFGTAVQLFSDSSSALTSQLQRIEAALDKSSSRSDDQLAYYVAQAREIIDLSLSSQKQVVDELQHLARRAQPATGEVA